MSSSSLPKWATIHKSSSDANNEEASTENTEQLLRLQSVRSWHFRLQQSARRAWNDVCEPAVRDFQSICSCQDASFEDASAEDNKNKFVIRPSEQYPFELLPCLIVNPPPTCKLDRQSMIQALFNCYKKRNRVCAVLLPKLMASLKQTLMLMWSQISKQEPSSRQTKMKFRLNKKTQSLQQIILWWASQTEQFDQLVVLLEDPGGFAHTKVRQEFYHALSDWRSEHGLPVSLIVMGAREQVCDLSFFNVRVRVMSPQDHNETWVCRFLQHLVRDDLPPPDLWANIGGLIQEYKTRHHSGFQLTQAMQQSIASFYTQKGSFVWDSCHSEEFVAWFCLYENANNLLENSDPGWQKYQQLQACRMIQDQIAHVWKGIAVGSPLFLRSTDEDISVKAALPTLAKLYTWMTADPTDGDTPKGRQQEKRYERLGDWLDPTQKSDITSLKVSGSTEKTNEKIKTNIKELILLVQASDNASGNIDEETIQEGLSEMIQQLYEWLGCQIDTWIDKWQNHCPIFVASEELVPYKNTIYPRLEAVEGLPQIAKTLYRLTEGRLSVGREEWLHSFGGSVEAFTQGVWFLMVTGLFQTKRARGGHIIYEKVPVVWTSNA